MQQRVVAAQLLLLGQPEIVRVCSRAQIAVRPPSLCARHGSHSLAAATASSFELGGRCSSWARSGSRSRYSCCSCSRGRLACGQGCSCDGI